MKPTKVAMVNFTLVSPEPVELLIDEHRNRAGCANYKAPTVGIVSHRASGPDEDF